MKTISVSVPQAASREYQIAIGEGTFQNLVEDLHQGSYSKFLFVIDGAVSRLHGEKFKTLPCITIPHSGEGQKTASLLGSLWEQFLQHKLDRGSAVVAVGGGATCDVVGFAASTYMRGISCINVPTTLLSQVDSSIGGKTGINLGKVKNVVGTFAAPKAVCIDTTFLKTLPQKEFSSGVAEILKHGIIYDQNLWAQLAAAPLIAADDPALEGVIEASLRVKKAVVEHDPYEKGLRKILNFGHTIGHAYETVSHHTGKPLLHGEAVSLGMLREAKLASILGMIPDTAMEEMQAVLLAHRLPVKVPAFSIESVLSAIDSDKKNRGGKLLFALPSAIGSCAFDVEVPRTTVQSVLEL